MNNENTTGSSQGAFAPEPRVYELGYLVMPSVDEGDLGTEREALVALITRFEGIVIEEGQPVLIDLAYEMDKMIKNKKHTYSQAYFGWIKFDVSPTGIEELSTEVEAFENLIRSILVKTVRENTVVSEQPFRLARAARGERAQEGSDLSDAEVNMAPEVKKEAVVEPTDAAETPTETSKADDLTKIEGIGPVIAKTLTEGGIASFAALASAKDADVQEMIKDVRGNHESTTWNEQAALACDGKFDELKTFQDKLDGGVEK